MTAADLGRGIGAQDIDPVALAQAFFDAIEDHPLSGRIYARLTPDRALAEAGAAAMRAKTGNRLSPLDGVPISWKDLFDTAGTATEAGSALLAGRVPDRDAEVLETATRLGLVCLGKTHMSELAFSGLGYNPITQTPPSVNDPDAVAGGSSSGAAASVAFGLAAAAVGTDTGGSVRIPAVWNDLVGLKTTSGQLPLRGVVPLAKSFDTVGPLCRTVEDASLLYGALGGRHPVDLQNATLAGKRFLLLESVALDDIRAEPLAGFNSAVQRLQAAGATIVRGELPCVANALALSPLLFAPEAYGTWKDQIEAAPDKMFAEILERFRGGGDILAAEFVKSWQELTVLREHWNRSVAAYDAVILPTAPILPPNLEKLATDHEYYVVENLLALRNTRIGNLFDLAGLTIPTGLPSTGIMFLTPPNSERHLLRLGVAAERALA
ncbi:MAG: amidase [Marinosulfonomonas sp.]|nr:amidase [Marinosulfonomonas sp.]